MTGHLAVMKSYIERLRSNVDDIYMSFIQRNNGLLWRERDVMNIVAEMPVNCSLLRWIHLQLHHILLGGFQSSCCQLQNLVQTWKDFFYFLSVCKNSMGKDLWKNLKGWKRIYLFNLIAGDNERWWHHGIIACKSHQHSQRCALTWKVCSHSYQPNKLKRSLSIFHYT